MLLPAVIWICKYTHVYWRTIDWLDTKYFYNVLNHDDYSESAFKNLLLLFTHFCSISVKRYALVWLEHSLLPVIIKETYHFTSHFWLVLAIDNYPNKNGYWKSYYIHETNRKCVQQNTVHKRICPVQYYLTSDVLNILKSTAVFCKSNVCVFSSVSCIPVRSYNQSEQLNSFNQYINQQMHLIKYNNIQFMGITVFY